MLSSILASRSFELDPDKGLLSDFSSMNDLFASD